MMKAESPEPSVDYNNDVGAENAQELLYEYVHEALVSRLRGESEDHYNQLCKEMAAITQRIHQGILDDVPLLENLLSALRSCCSLLHDRRHGAITTVVFGLSPWATPARVRVALLDLYVSMAIANGQMVERVLATLCDALVPRRAPEDADPVGPWSIHADAAAAQADVVSALARTVQLVPTSAGRVLSGVTAKAPFKSLSREWHCMYVSGLVRLAEDDRASAVRDGIESLMISHVLEIDCEIKWEDIVETRELEAAEEQRAVLAEEADNPDLEDIFALDGMTEAQVAAQHLGAGVRGGTGWEGPGNVAAHGGGPRGPEPDAERRRAVEVMASKIDALMEIVLGHYSRRVQGGHLGQLWFAALQAFERVVLSTYRCKFTQYLMFQLCAQSPESCCGPFLDLLLSKLTDVSLAPVTRSAAAAYLASFLARAAFVPPGMVLEAVGRQMDWVWGYLRDMDRRASEGEAGTRGREIRMTTGEAAANVDQQTRHQVMFATVQGVLYVLCYCLEPIFGERMQGHRTPAASQHQDALRHRARDLVQQVLPPILQHRLEPLAVCLPSVADEFFRIVRRLGLVQGPLMSAYSQNNQRRADAIARAAVERPLQMFFPFDPYLLRRSANYLHLPETYVTWRGGHPGTGHREFGEVEAGSTDDSESDEDENDGLTNGRSVEGDSAGASDLDDDDDGTDDLGKSVEMMSVGARMGRLHGGYGYPPVHRAHAAAFGHGHGAVPGASGTPPYHQDGFAQPGGPGGSSPGGGSSHSASLGTTPFGSSMGGGMSWMTGAGQHMMGIKSRLGKSNTSK